MYELLMQNMRGTEQVGRGDNQPAIDAMIVPPRPMPGRPDNNLAQNARVHAQAGRASSWARSRPCVVVGAEPAVRRRGRRAGRASSWARSRPCIVLGADLTMRRPAGLLDLRRRCAAARRGVRGIRAVLRRASGAQFLIARVDVAPGGAPPPRRRRGRASRGGLRGGRRQPRAGRRRGVRGLCCSVARPSSIKLASTCGGVGRGALPPRCLRGHL